MSFHPIIERITVLWNGLALKEQKVGTLHPCNIVFRTFIEINNYTHIPAFAWCELVPHKLVLTYKLVVHRKFVRASQ